MQTLTEEDMQTEATIRQTCERCGRDEVKYYTLQLRSADEGSTVFYTCECGHKSVYPDVVLDAELTCALDGTPTTKFASLS